MKNRILIAYLITALFIGCKSSSGPSDKISVSVPNGGYLWEDSVQFNADISISKDITVVSWLLNGSVMTIQDEPPYSINFDTTTMTYGDIYELSVIVTDSDNKGISSEIYNIIKIPFNIPSTSFNDISDYTESDVNGNLTGTIDHNDWKLIALTDIPSEMSSRYASVKNVVLSGTSEKITINWEAEDVYDNLGFNILRGYSSSDYTNNNAFLLNYSGIIPNNTIMEYAYSDSFNLSYNTDYYYWIEIVNTDNTKYTYPIEGYKFTFYDPDEFKLTFNKCYPNPAGSSTKIPFVLEEESEVTFMFFNQDKSYFEVPVQDMVFERGNNEYIWNILPQDPGLYRCLYYVKCLSSGEVYYGFGDIFIQ